MSKRKSEKSNCLNCGNKVNRKPKKFCNNFCQMEYQYKEYISNWLAGKISGVIGKTKSVSKYIRKWLKETRGDKCEKCGWNEKHPITGNVPVEINHIDGNADNANPDNLELLCPNCHSLTLNFRSLNKNSTRIR